MKRTQTSLPQVRQDLKTLLAAERDANRRKELGRALAAIVRAESAPIDKPKQPC